MNTRTTLLLLAGSLTFAAAGSVHGQADTALTVTAPRFQARFRGGSLTSLIDVAGHELVRAVNPPAALTIQRVGQDHATTTAAGDAVLNSQHPQATRQYGSFAELPGATARATYRLDSDSSDLIVSQQAQSPAPGVWGIGWSIGKIPLDYAIIVPGRSGIRLTRSTPGRTHQFDYPLGWEAQLVIVEGSEYGFYVWAEDPVGRYKRLVVRRDNDGWQLDLVTINDAPFEPLTECTSVPWRVNVYEGDWRVPARRYRDWATQHFQPTPIHEQRPAWVRDTRAMVIMGLDLPTLELLPTRLDPHQTVLYIPGWRTAGYDRDYPVYDQPVEQLRPFVERAHALGFRVMLHVNYFGVDPLNPLYARFKPFHYRSPWGEHPPQWWLWTRAEPEIRFAYINPASQQWRDYFTQAMVRLCTDCQIDALHLDQTLVIDNDYNGRIDGLTMLEGNVALHRQLRAALPEVALSGEGLNEVTYRHEAFAQRHAWGVNHADSTWDLAPLATAHPISSYLFRPYVIINGYLGCAPPSQGQLYGAWQTAYQHWGVIPTLKPDRNALQDPTGFMRQFCDEVAFWQQAQLEIDLDADWPANVRFPLRAADGTRAVYTTDGCLLHQDQLVCRTVTGTNRLLAPGTIPGWLAFNDRELIGLDPTAWYPYFAQPRSDDTFHVLEVPSGIIVQSASVTGELAAVRTLNTRTIVADLVALLDSATTGSRNLTVKPFTTQGPFTSPDGAQFQAIRSGVLAAHPPYKAVVGRAQRTADGPSYPTAFARYEIQLPSAKHLRLVSEVALDSAAAEQPRADGVTFGLLVRAGSNTLETQAHQATAEPQTLELDLSALAGQKITVELTVHPGPNRVPDFDWARWLRPRIEQDVRGLGSLAVTGPQTWSTAIGATGLLTMHANGQSQLVRTELPGTVFFLANPPPAVALPADIAKCHYYVTQENRDGLTVATHDFLRVHATTSTVGGTARTGLFAHPPDFGQTRIHVPLVLGDQPAEFRAHVGIRDGSQSTGVVFRVEVNGQIAFEQRVTPGEWNPIAVDLAPFRSTPVVLSLITDSDGPFNCDWAQWGEPRLVARKAEGGKREERRREEKRMKSEKEKVRSAN